jgi:prepilin-type N-terminal cleavage/methylation domain-containing protein
MKQQQRGFTLIELVMVIVILGILAAVAIPRFTDLRADASQAAVLGVAGSLSSASAVNFAARTANSSNGVAITNCTSVASALQGGLPTGYSIDSVSISANGTATCTVTATDGGTTKTASFVGLGIN